MEYSSSEIYIQREDNIKRDLKEIECEDVVWIRGSDRASCFHLVMQNCTFKFHNRPAFHEQLSDYQLIKKHLVVACI